MAGVSSCAQIAPDPTGPPPPSEQPGPLPDTNGWLHVRSAAAPRTWTLSRAECEPPLGLSEWLHRAAHADSRAGPDRRTRNLSNDARDGSILAYRGTSGY